MNRESVDLPDFGLDGILRSQHANNALAADNSPPKRARRLVARKHDAAFSTSQVVDQVVLNSTCGAHSRAGDNRFNGNRAAGHVWHSQTESITVNTLCKKARAKRAFLMMQGYIECDVCHQAGQGW